MDTEKALVVVPWHNPAQQSLFCNAWKITPDDPRVVFQQDKDRSGCAVTKNRGIDAAVTRGADIVIILDDDCFPNYPKEWHNPLNQFIADHVKALNTPVEYQLFKAVTSPQSRGTPIMTSKSVQLEVAAAMGFWTHVGDYDAVHQLVVGAKTPMQFDKEPIFGQYFPLCGMNLCFRPKDWAPWWSFINVSRFDDIWQGWLWQKEAFRRNCAFRLDGPEVFHSRQSNVWANLRDETIHMEANDTLWRDIALSSDTEYGRLRRLLPV